MVVKLASGFLAHLPRDGIEARLGERLAAVVLCDRRLEAVPPHDIEAHRPFLLQRLVAHRLAREILEARRPVHPLLSDDLRARLDEDRALGDGVPWRPI